MTAISNTAGIEGALDLFSLDHHSARWLVDPAAFLEPAEPAAALASPDGSPFGPLELLAALSRRIPPDEAFAHATHWRSGEAHLATPGTASTCVDIAIGMDTASSAESLASTLTWLPDTTTVTTSASSLQLHGCEAPPPITGPTPSALAYAANRTLMIAFETSTGKTISDSVCTADHIAAASTELIGHDELSDLVARVPC